LESEILGLKGKLSQIESEKNEIQRDSQLLGSSVQMNEMMADHQRKYDTLYATADSNLKKLVSENENLKLELSSNRATILDLTDTVKEAYDRENLLKEKLESISTDNNHVSMYNDLMKDADGENRCKPTENIDEDEKQVLIDEQQKRIVLLTMDLREKDQKIREKEDFINRSIIGDDDK
jgi:hypothetical protein